MSHKILSHINEQISPLEENIFNTKQYANIDNFVSHLYEFKEKYNYINELVDFLVFSKRFAEDYHYGIYDRYIKNTLLHSKFTLKNVNNLTIHFSVFSYIQKQNENF